MTERQRVLLAHLEERLQSAKEAYTDQKLANQDTSEVEGPVPIDQLEKEAELWGRVGGLSIGVITLRDALIGPDEERK